MNNILYEYNAYVTFPQLTYRTNYPNGYRAEYHGLDLYSKSLQVPYLIKERLSGVYFKMEYATDRNYHKVGFQTAYYREVLSHTPHCVFDLRDDN